MVLKITDVRAGTVLGNYYWTFVRIYAGKEYGTGEGFFAPQLEGTVREIGRLLKGEDALQITKLVDKLRWASVPSGESGANYHAISAIEIALLDLIGKHRGVPVYELLGGKFRDEVRLYVDAHAGKALEAMDTTLLPIEPLWMKELGAKKKKLDTRPVHGRATMEKYRAEFSPESYASRAKEMRGEGYTAIKFDLDIPTPYTKGYNKASGSLSNNEVKFLSALVGHVRGAVGEEVDILLDTHWRFNVQSAIRIAKSIEKYDVMWLEDPVPPSNPDLLNVVAEATTTPIATGENLYTRYGFREVNASKVRIVTPDALKAGGLIETKFIAETAGMNEKSVSPHNIASPIGTMAQAHLSAAIANMGVLEFHGHDVLIWYKLVKGGDRIIDRGFIRLPDVAGLGIELDESVARKYSLNETFEL